VQTGQVPDLELVGAGLHLENVRAGLHQDVWSHVEQVVAGNVDLGQEDFSDVSYSGH